MIWQEEIKENDSNASVEIRLVLSLIKNYQCRDIK